MNYIVTCALILILAGSNIASGGTPTVTNLTDQAFTVSWTTTALEKGWVEYKTSDSMNMKAYDDRGQETVDDTHYVTIRELSGTTTYYCQVVSGGVRGSLFTITTVVDIYAPGDTGIATGKVCFQETTILAEGSIVYARLKTTTGTESDAQSTIVGRNEPWSISLNRFRKLDGSSPFQYSSGDSLIVEVEAAGDGMATGTTKIATTTDTIIDTGTLTLSDTVAPPDIFTTCVVPGNTCVQIGLTMPVQNSGVAGMVILRNERDYPQATLTAGQTYTVNETVTDSTVVCVSTNTTTWTDDLLINGTTYYYQIFLYDGMHNYSQGIVYQATPAINLDNAVVYPNPLTGDGVVHFAKLKANTHICIYNIAGELVFETDAPDGTCSWCPKDKDIASGIYLYLLKDDNGHIKTGKIGVVK